MGTDSPETDLYDREGEIIPLREMLMAELARS
jgi:hypothetical protein